MRKVDGWENLSQALEPMPLDLAAWKTNPSHGRVAPQGNFHGIHDTTVNDEALFFVWQSVQISENAACIGQSLTVVNSPARITCENLNVDSRISGRAPSRGLCRAQIDGIQVS